MATEVLDTPTPAAPTGPVPPVPPTRNSGDDSSDRRVRIPFVTGAGVTSLFAAAFGALALTWVVFERVLPLSGALGFWLVAYVTFLCLYAAICSTQWPGKVVVDRVVAVVLSSAALLVLAIVADQVGYTIFRGKDALFHGNFFTDTMAETGPLDPLTSGGMFHALIGSLEQMGIATLLAVPLGILAALFLVEVGGPLARPVRTIVEAMTALPEIIAGLFVYAFLILSFGFDPSGFAASVALAVTMIPIVTRASEVILRLVPGGLREASYALGASQVRTVFNVVLPTARSGLATAVILAMARAVGETSPVLFTAGFTKDVNTDPFSGPQTSLPLYIFQYVRLPQHDMVARAFGAGLALMLMVLVLFAIARLVGGRVPGQLSRRQQRRLHLSSEAARAQRAAMTASITAVTDRMN